MFGNVEEMWLYVDKLRKLTEDYREHRKKQLNNICEACNENEIELEYKYNNYADEILTKDGMKLKIYNHFFCKSCYKIIIETKRLPRCEWMENVDREIWPEWFDEENTESNQYNKNRGTYIDNDVLELYRAQIRGVKIYETIPLKYRGFFLYNINNGQVAELV